MLACATIEMNLNNINLTNLKDSRNSTEYGTAKSVMNCFPIAEHVQEKTEYHCRRHL